ncbi:MAG: Omp28-related outer membrane protein [Flavobacteriaceae bacterium]|nr:Omp28-related outer membrane protein [Flavobacteriaceae bacterium]
MFKQLLGIVACFFLAFTATAQTIVSTTPENKKVILEEFTGIHCVFCPEGHAIAKAIQDNNPGEVFLINVHVGSFAVPGAGEPDFRTSFGTQIANQSQLVGYPAATVNRHYFPGMAQNGGTGTAMSRNVWANASNQTLALPSYLNMAVEADIDVQTNELSVHVEAYYTGNSPQASNKLNVALLQNNTLGPQTGGNAGVEYVHQHRLIHLVTGQWGDDVSPTTTGSFIDRTYNYTIPAMHNNVPIKIEDLELVVFMTETTQEIISGNGSFPTYSNFEFQNDATAKLVQQIPDQCGFDFSPVVEIQNTGENAITSLNIDYSINGGTVETYTWTGNLTSLQTEAVELPAIPYDIQAVNTVEVTIQNDDDNSNNIATQTFNQTAIFSNTIRLVLNVNNQGSQNTWEILDVDGNVIESGGPYANGTNVNETFIMPGGNCYQFNYHDSGNNGGGAVALLDENNDVIYSSSGNYGSGFSVSFATEGFLGVNSNPLEKIALFPNPAQSVFTIKNAENANVVIFDILGKTVLSQNTISSNQEVKVSHLAAGTYFVKLEKDGFSTVEKLIINR